jgi:hypothetical protein
LLQKRPPFRDLARKQAMIKKNPTPDSQAPPMIIS